MGGREVGFSLVAFKGNLTNVPDSNVWKCSVLLPEWNRIQQDRVGWDKIRQLFTTEEVSRKPKTKQNNKAHTWLPGCNP